MKLRHNSNKSPSLPVLMSQYYYYAHFICPLVILCLAILFYTCRAASLLYCGSENMYNELRVRTLCELVMNEDFYLKPSVISVLDPAGKEVLKQGLPATSANYLEALTSSQINVDLARSVFYLDCLQTTNNGEYANMWHVHGLASVLKRKIMSVYPEQNCRIRPLFHRIIIPRSAGTSSAELIIIMWTRTSDAPGKTWSPNHFAPCYSSSTPSLRSDPTLTSFLGFFPIQKPSSVSNIAVSTSSHISSSPTKKLCLTSCLSLIAATTSKPPVVTSILSHSTASSLTPCHVSSPSIKEPQLISSLSLIAASTSTPLVVTSSLSLITATPPVVTSILSHSTASSPTSCHVSSPTTKKPQLISCLSLIAATTATSPVVTSILNHSTIISPTSCHVNSPPRKKPRLTPCLSQIATTASTSPVVTSILSHSAASSPIYVSTTPKQKSFSFSSSFKSGVTVSSPSVQQPVVVGKTTTKPQCSPFPITMILSMIMDDKKHSCLIKRRQSAAAQLKSTTATPSTVNFPTLPGVSATKCTVYTTNTIHVLSTASGHRLFNTSPISTPTLSSLLPTQKSTLPPVLANSNPTTGLPNPTTLSNITSGPPSPTTPCLLISNPTSKSTQLYYTVTARILFKPCLLATQHYYPLDTKHLIGRC